MNNMKLINIGFGNMVSAARLIAIVSPESAPIKRIIQNAKEKNMLIDATYGRRSRSVLVTDSDHVILSPIQPETIANRLSSEYEAAEEEENEEEEAKKEMNAKGKNDKNAQSKKAKLPSATKKAKK